MNYNYTLLIPHYNIPFLLRRLLKSVPRRDDLQVIVVDDCSFRDLGEYDKLREEYDWVEWYDTGVNGGGGKARNIGLSHAKGKYVIFADADDYFEKDFPTILSEYSLKNFDIAFFKGVSRDTDSGVMSNRADHLNRYVDMYLNGSDSDANNLRFLFGEPWCKIISKSLIDRYDIRFDETVIHNDTTFGYLTGFYAKKILVDEREIYCVTTRKGSVSVTKSDDRILTRIEVFSRAELLFIKHKVHVKLEEHYIQLVRLFVHRKFLLLGRCVNLMRRMGFSRKYILNRCQRVFISILRNRIG